MRLVFHELAVPRDVLCMIKTMTNAFSTMTRTLIYASFVQPRSVMSPSKNRVKSHICLNAGYPASTPCLLSTYQKNQCLPSLHRKYLQSLQVHFYTIIHHTNLVNQTVNQQRLRLVVLAVIRLVPKRWPKVHNHKPMLLQRPDSPAFLDHSR